MNPPALPAADDGHRIWYARYLLFLAGLGGLVVGFGGGIMASAVPFLLASYQAGEVSFIVAAYLLGGIPSSLTAGAMSDFFGRKWVMFVAGVLFVASLPVICFSHGYVALFIGRLVQGTSAGFVGVALLLYLAECLPAETRGRGTAIFHFLLTAGLVVAALIGLAAAKYVAGIETVAGQLVAKDAAWRTMFALCAIPGLVLVGSVLRLCESPRWLFRRGRTEAARAALLHSRSAATADLEMREMEEARRAAAQGAAVQNSPPADSLLSRKYVVPFVLAFVIVVCTQACGVSSIFYYVVNILDQAGLPGVVAFRGDVILTTINCLMTIPAILLVDRKGRKFLLSLGSGGLVVSLTLAGILSLSAERDCVDCKAFFQGRVKGNALTVTFDSATLAEATAGTPLAATFADGRPATVTLVYAYGPFGNVQTRRTEPPKQTRRTDPPKAKPIEISRENTVPQDRTAAWLSNPLADFDAGQTAPLEIKKAMIGPAPSVAHGWLVASCLFLFMATFAVGPGMCVWLAMTELLPTRIRSNGMSIALFFNTIVSTTIAAVFLPTVGSHGYSAMFFFWAGCSVVYFITTAFFLPETKGKTLEEIEAHFAGRAGH